MSIVTMSPELRDELARHPGQPLRLVDPETNTAFVVMEAKFFDRISAGAYDDSPWTDDEKDRLALEAGKSIGWDEMGEYDSFPGEVK
jgi:hypothetical protein